MEESIPSVEEIYRVFLLINHVAECIRYVLNEHDITKQDIIDSIVGADGLPLIFARSVWELVEEKSPQFFRAYYARLKWEDRNRQPLTIRLLPPDAPTHQMSQTMQNCFRREMTLQQTIESLFTLRTPPAYTQIVWETLERQNPKFFHDYYARLAEISNGQSSNGSHLPTEDMLARVEILERIMVDSVDEIHRVILLINHVAECIRYIINEHDITKQDIIDSIVSADGVPLIFARSVWELVEEQRPQFFRAYYARLKWEDRDRDPLRFQLLPPDAPTHQISQNMQNCFQREMTLQQTIESLSTDLRVPPAYTQIVWETLEQRNPKFFHDYYARLAEISNGKSSHLSTEDMLARVQHGIENTTLNGAWRVMCILHCGLSLL